MDGKGLYLPFFLYMKQKQYFFGTKRNDCFHFFL